MHSRCDSPNRPFGSFHFRILGWRQGGYGDPSKVVLHFKSVRSAREILKKDFTGLGEAYMLGEVEVEGDLRELLRLGFAIKFYLTLKYVTLAAP